MRETHGIRANLKKCMVNYHVM